MKAIFNVLLLRKAKLLKCKQTWCLTFTENIRLIRDGEKGGRGMAVAEEGEYIHIATLFYKPQPLKRRGSQRGESNQPCVRPLTSLPPYRCAKPAHVSASPPTDHCVTVFLF